MNKNVLRFGFSFIIISLLTLCISVFSTLSNSNSLVLASTDNVIVENLDNSIFYNYITKPSHLAVVSENEFYLTDENKDIYKFKNNTLTLVSNSFRDLIDMYYYDGALYILKAGEIIKYNASTNEIIYSNSTILSSPKNIVVTRDAYFVNNTNSFVYLSSNLANVVTRSQFEYNSTLIDFDTIYNMYAISSNQVAVLHKYSSDSSTFITKFNVTDTPAIEQVANKKVLSTDTDANLKLSGFSSYYTISKENSLYVVNNDSTSVEFNTTTPLISSATDGSSNSYKSGKILNIADYFIYDNSLLICDNNVRSNSVQRFNIQVNIQDNKPDNKPVFDGLLVASCSADVNRLYKPIDFSLFDQNYLYVLDNGNSRIVLKDLKNNTNTEITDQELINPTAIDTSINGDTYVISNTPSGQKLIVFNNTSTKTKSIAINDYTISDIQCGYDDKVYMLDSVNKKLLSINKNAQITELVNLSELSFVGTAKIKLNASGNKIYLLADNTIYNIDLSQSVLNEDKYSPTDTIIDYMLDYNNNLYCILKNSSDEYSIKNIPSSAMPTTPIALPNVKYTSYENIIFDITSGTIYNCDKTYHKIETINITNFFDVLNDFKTDYSFKEHPTATGATIARVNQNCKTYKYPFYAGSRLELAENDKVIVIDKTCALNDNFAYVMIANKETKNVLAYVNANCLTYDVTEEQTTFNKIKVWFIGKANVYLYYLPTGLEFEDSPESFKYNKTAKLNEEFNILGLACGYRDASDMQYYTVQLENGDIVYLKACYAIDANSTKGVATFQPNAKVEKNSSADKLTLYKFDEETKTYIATEYELQNGQAIQVLPDSANNPENAYLHIKFEDSNGKLVTYYYVEAKYVVYNDITWLQIIGIILGILAIILIIIAAVIIYKNNKKKQIQKLENE